MKSKFESKNTPPLYEIDLTEAWNTAAEADMFITALKSLGIYHPNLRFSGFNADDIGIKNSSDENPGVVFCSTESDLYKGSEGFENALNYAFGYLSPAVAIYDNSKLEIMDMETKYKILDESALIAIVKLKG